MTEEEFRFQDKLCPMCKIINRVWTYCRDCNKKQARDRRANMTPEEKKAYIASAYERVKKRRNGGVPPSNSNPRGNDSSDENAIAINDGAYE